MTRPWEISAGIERVQLDPERQAELTFTVINKGPLDERAVVDMVPGDPAERSWFAVAEPQRLVSHGQSAPFTVRMTVPPGVPPGPRWVQARVYSADKPPEETSVLSNRVAFDVPGGAAGSGNRWLWLIPAALLVLAVLGVGAYLLLRSGEPDGLPQATPLPTTTAEQTTDEQATTPEPTPEPTQEATTPEAPPPPPPIGNLIASVDGTNCAVVSGSLQVYYYLLLIGANPEELPGLVAVSAQSDSGATDERRSAVSNQALSHVEIPVRGSDVGRTVVVTITVDSAGEVPETDEGDNVIQVSARIPAGSADDLPCSATRG